MIRIGMICASLFSTILTNKTLTIMTWAIDPLAR